MGDINKVRELIEEQKKIMMQISKAEVNLDKIGTKQEKKFLTNHINNLRNKLGEINDSINNELRSIEGPKKLNAVATANYEREQSQPEAKGRYSRKLSKENRPEGLERETIKRITGQGRERKGKKESKPSKYVSVANKTFGRISGELVQDNFFRKLKRDLVQANLQFLPASYISTMIFSTVLAFLLSIFVVLFLMFFNITPTFPIFHLVDEPFWQRFLKVFWVMLIIPLFTLIAMYFYPNLEKRNIEYRIDQELPFATINMSAISGSMIDPTRIFSIIISTGEYPYLEKEFTKIMNEINVYGYNLVAALRRVAFNTSSKKLSDLLNGLATTVTSGGDMPEFFNKRSQSLLFEYRLEREKYTRAAETFMDIYISVVIASPMILMLLLMMMRVSGLGVSLSTGMISLIMVLGVTGINFIFLLFLHLKQPTG